MSKGARQLEEMLRTLRELDGFATRATPDVAVALGDEVRRQVARGENPLGQTWEPTKDGRVPLRGAAKAVQITTVRDTVIMRLEGHHARHHLGAVKGKVKREIIPNRRIPQPMTRAIERVITGEFDRITRGGRR